MSDDAGENDLFNIAIATIFAREFLEGSLIIGNYRTAILKSETDNEGVKKEKLRAVTIAASVATFVAFLVVLAVAIPLGVLSNELDERVVEVIEGVSKMVGAIAILQLSLKIPVWLGCYAKVPLNPCKKRKYDQNKDKNKGKDVGVSIREIRFNVAWNIWREGAECGVFLIPFFLGTGAKAVPVSAAVGIAISLFLGVLIYIANNRMTNKFWLSFFMAGLMLMLSVGLFVGGCHEFEEVWGETRKIWKIENEALSHKKLPMVLLKPFGYSASRTILQIATFWSWLGLGLGLHFLKWRNTVAARASPGYNEGQAATFDKEGAEEISEGTDEKEELSLNDGAEQGDEYQV